MTTNKPPLHVQEAANESIRQAEDHANEAWKEAALEAIQVCARKNSHFTVDEVWDFIPPGKATREGRAMGSIMRKAQKEHWIEATSDFRASSKGINHGRPQRVWKSLIYQPEHFVKMPGGGFMPLLFE